MKKLFQAIIPTIRTPSQIKVPIMKTQRLQAIEISNKNHIKLNLLLRLNLRAMAIGLNQRYLRRKITHKKSVPQVTLLLIKSEMTCKPLFTSNVLSSVFLL